MPPLKSEALEPGMRVGLFGGSFDPPHAGHAHVAETALKRFGLHKVWWIVSPQNPLKPHAPGDLAERMEAATRWAKGPSMVVTDIEARLGARHTAELIAALETAHPRVRFVWLMGSDNLAHFHRWARWREIAARTPIGVIARPGRSLAARLSPAAKALQRWRVPESRARALAVMAPPAWTYLTGPLYTEASSALRGDLARA